MKRFLKLLLVLTAAAMLLALGVSADADASAPRFSDVPADHWAYAAVEELAARGIVSGKGDGSYFDPDANVTVAEFTAMMTRMFYPEEVAYEATWACDDWYDAYFIAAYRHEIGESVGIASMPNEPLTVGNMLFMAHAYLTDKVDLLHEDDAALLMRKYPDFTDYTMKNAVYGRMLQAGVINEADAAKPNGDTLPISRAKACTVLHQLEQLTAGKVPAFDYEAEIARGMALIEPDMTELEKAVILYNFVMQEFTYDQGFVYQGLYTTMSGKYSHDLDIVMQTNGAVCDSYASLYQLLLDRAGIENKYVISEKMNHGWNLVKIDGNWYHTDATWDDADNLSLYTDNGALLRNFLRSDSEFKNSKTNNKHYGWSISETADKSGAFIGTIFRRDDKTTSGLVQRLGDRYYAIVTRDNVKYLAAGTMDGTVYTEYDLAYDYTNLLAYNGKLYASTTTAIHEISTNGTLVKTIAMSNGEITCFTHRDGRLSYCEMYPDKTYARIYLTDAHFNNTHLKAVVQDIMSFTVNDRTKEAALTTVDVGEADRTYTAKIDLVIPSYVNGYPVTTIGASVCAYIDYKHGTIRSVTLPDTLVTIQSRAFYKQQSLKEIIIPASVKYIGESVFHNCTLNDCKLIFAGEMPFVDYGGMEGAFYNSSGTPINVAITKEYVDSLNKNGRTYDAATGRWYRANGTKYDNISVIEPDFFTDRDKYCGYNLTWSVKGDTLTITGSGHMWDYSFNLYNTYAPWYEHRNEIKKIVLPEGLTNISYGAFYSLREVKSVTIPSTVTSIGRYAFNFTGITSVTIPASVKDIGYRAFFSYTTELTSVTFKGKPESIGDEAFKSAAKSTKVTLPAGVKLSDIKLGKNVFGDD